MDTAYGMRPGVVLNRDAFFDAEQARVELTMRFAATAVVHATPWSSWCSRRNLIDPSLQDNVVVSSGFFQYIYHIGCAFNLHSIINNGLILGGRNLSKRQTVFFLPVDPMDKNQKDPDTIDLNAPRHAHYRPESAV